MRYLLAAFALFLFVAAPAAAQLDARSRSADALFGKMAADEPGAVVIIARGGETLYSRAFGSADLEQRQRITLDTRFHVASVSKQFTALAVALLAQDGRIDLDADVRKYLPELPDFGAKIRVADLLHHTSGLRDQWDLLELSGTGIESLITQEAILGLVRAQRELNFVPQTEYRYSNTGYSLAAEVVARVSGMPFRRFVQKRIFTPLGMKSSLIYDNAAELIPGRAQSYGLSRAGVVGLRRLNFSNYGATSMFTTAADLLKWSREILHPRVFKPALIASLHEPTRLLDGTPSNYGLGMYRSKVRDHTSIMHGGSDAGFRALMASHPDQDVSMIILSNGSADVGRLHEGLVDVYLNEQRKPDPVVQPTANQLARLAGYYASGWGAGLELKVEGNDLVRAAGAPPGRATFRLDGTIEFSAPTMRLKVLGSGSGPALALKDRPISGPPVRYDRVEKVAVSRTDLMALAGRYRSPELDITYELAVADDALTLSSLQSPNPVPLTSIGRNWFDLPGARLTIVRGTDERPEAIRITTGRVRNLRFERVR